MSEKAEAALPSLPIEMIHRIFDELNGTIVFLAMRDVCQRLRAAVDKYPRHVLDFTALSKPDLHPLLPVIRPECVIALSLSDEETIPGQIDISLFTGLRSLTLLNISYPPPPAFLRQAKKCLLTSFTLSHRLKLYSPLEHQEFVEHLSAIIAQPTLVRLELLTRYPRKSKYPVEWPSQSKLQHLTIACDSQSSLSTILDRLPDLTTLVLHDESGGMHSIPSFSEDVFSTPYPRLTSLTILRRFHLPHPVLSLPSYTPCLAYLKITGTCDLMIDGARWEALIMAELPALHKFEFHEISRKDRHDTENAKTLLNRVIASFRTPFWTDEKRWLVIGTWHPTEQSIETYTSLIDTPDYLPFWHPDTLSVTNFARQNEYYTKYEDVLRLQLVSYGRHRPENSNEQVNSGLLPNLTDLSIPLDCWNSHKSVPTGVNLLTVTNLSLSLSYKCPAKQMILDGLTFLLRQTPNIHSLAFSGRLIGKLHRQLVEQICLIVARYIDPSKLRDLSIPVINVDGVRKLLDELRELSSIKFYLSGTSAEYGEIAKYLRTLTSDYSIEEHDSSLFIKMERRLVTRNSFKRNKADPSSGHGQFDLH